MAVNRVQRELNFKLCIVCQKETDIGLVDNPVSHEKLLKFIRERFEYGDSKFAAIRDLLGDITPQQLVLNNASWHRGCYQEAVHIGKLKRVQERYERDGNDEDSKRKKFTRSQTAPYDKEVCFFCEDGPAYRETLHSVSTSSAGQFIRAAVQITGNERLMTKLSTAINTDDAHAIDIKYHNKCYTTNVRNVLRRSQSSSDEDSAEIAARLEFLDIIENTLREGKTLNMTELESVYMKVLQENDVANPSCCRKVIKQLLSNKIPDVAFHRPKRKNEPERVTVKQTRDDSILSSETAYSNDSGMKDVYNAAAVLRKSINKCKNWEFTGTGQHGLILIPGL